MGHSAYLIINLPFIIVGLFAAYRFDRLVFKRRTTWLIVGGMLLMTAVFDNYLTGMPIVTYDASKISNIRLWHAPIEDFCYTLVVSFIVPAAWRRFARNVETIQNPKK